MNKPLLEKVIETITAHPEKFDMGRWCGTAKCIGGWAATLVDVHPELAPKKNGTETESVKLTGQRELELTDQQAENLLYATNWPKPFGPPLSRENDLGIWEHKISVARAVKRIRHFIATEGKE